MNAYARSQLAYSQNKAATRSEQSIEYELFAKVTSALAHYSDDRKKDYSGFVSAIHNNRRLWLALASDVAEDGNALPKDLRAQLFYLAEFTRVHSSKVISEDASIAPLIDINRSIMKGLFAQRGAA
jgi:flagellar protein FlaF